VTNKLDYIDSWPDDSKTHILAVNPAFLALLDGLIFGLQYPGAWQGTEAQQLEMVEKMDELRYVLNVEYECPGGGGTGVMELIDSQELASDDSLITFADISQTYENLILRIRARSAASGGTYVMVRLNEDAANKHTSTFYAASYVQYVSQSWWLAGYATQYNAPSGHFGFVEMKIPRYTVAECHDMVMLSQFIYGTAFTAAGGAHGGGVYDVAEAIDTIDVKVTSGDMEAGTVVELWGEGEAPA